MALTANQPLHREQAKIMNRFDITQRLVARLLRDEAVIGGIGYTNFDLWAAGRRPQNFYMLGSMGLAIPIALGVALAQPKRRVIALEGDGSLLMQTSGFATLANVLASLAIPYQVPLIMFVSERGTLGEFNYGQSLVCRTMRPVLDSLAMEHHTCTRLDEFEFIVDRSIKQAITTQAPVALILNPLLTGGKVFEK